MEGREEEGIEKCVGASATAVWLVRVRNPLSPSVISVLSVVNPSPSIAEFPIHVEHEDPLLTTIHTTPNIEHMNYSSLYEKLRLDELGISSDEEAEELEYELDLRFEHFSPKDREIWLQQNVYLEHFTRTGTIDSAAGEAGVTIYTAQRWQHDNVLGFPRRLEVAAISFKGGLQRKALVRASEPNAPATLIIELLRSYIPEQFSRSGRKDGTSKPDDAPRHYHENARREREAGYPILQRIAQGDPDPFRHNPDPEPTERQTPTAISVPSVVSPSARHSGGGRYPQDGPSTLYGSDEGSRATTSPDIDVGFDGHDYQPSDVVDPPQPSPTRAERREHLRQQRKAEKKNTFPVKRF